MRRCIEIEIEREIGWSIAIDRSTTNIYSLHIDIYIYTSMLYTLRESNVAIGNPLEMGGSIGKSPINCVSSIAMFDFWRVYIYIYNYI